MKLSKNSLQTLKHIYQGMGTTLELQPKRSSIVRRYKPAETSAKALQGDWQKVGAQLRRALKSHDKLKDINTSLSAPPFFHKDTNNSKASDDFSGEANLKIKE